MIQDMLLMAMSTLDWNISTSHVTLVHWAQCVLRYRGTDTVVTAHHQPDTNQYQLSQCDQVSVTLRLRSNSSQCHTIVNTGVTGDTMSDICHYSLVSLLSMGLLSLSCIYVSRITATT